MRSKSSRNVVLGAPALALLSRGIQRAADALAVTYGAQGGTILMERHGGHLATRDGATVSREISWEDPIEEMGRRVLRDACLRVDREAGDGTTTTAILTSALLSQARRYCVDGGYDPGLLAREMAEGADLVQTLIEQLARPVRRRRELYGICLHASHGDVEISNLITDACMSSGPDGMVLISGAHGVDSYLEFQDCLFFNSGCPSDKLLDGHPSKVIEEPLLALFSHPLTSARDIMSTLEEGSQWPDNPVVLIAPYIEAEALGTLVLNHTKGNIKCCALNLPSYGRTQRGLLEDLAAFSGATVIERDLGMDPKAFNPEWFGSVRSLDVSLLGASFVAYEEAREKAQERVRELHRQLSACDYPADRDSLIHRLAQLQGGVATLRVGGSTEGEIREKRSRVEDVLGSVQGSLRAGVVPGGGRVYQLAGELVREHAKGRWGMLSLARALEEPVRVLLRPLGRDNNLSIAQLGDIRRTREGWMWWGWDTKLGKIRDLREEPWLVDSATVASASVRAAVSTVSTLVKTGAAICLRKGKR